ncbi:MAG: hypothetical protein JSV57_05265 [Candidatus Bathyarchaeota archaeon]|nr:MAG: hypothetical protein JSV57_05265 [Candidatus Bathyarchaeota archaeon]
MSLSDFLARFSVVEELIKRREGFFKNLKEQKRLRTYFINFNIAIIVFSAVYGATMGVYPGGLQVFYDAVKIPMLLLISLYVTVPSYYVLSSLFGGECSFSQMVILLLSSLTVMSTVLLALVPINLFFILTTANATYSAYAFLVILNVVIFALAGLFALTFLLSGLMTMYSGIGWSPAFLVGSIIFMFVGTQLAWVLRPYFHYYPQFIRPVERNFYVAMIELVIRFLGGLFGFRGID